MSEYGGLKRITVWALMTLVTAIVLSAAAPARADHSFILPASDNGCGVDLQAEAEHGSGRASARIGYGDITFTNLETGATYLQRSRYSARETFDPSTGSTHVTILGNIWHAVFPGEPGPAGVVQEPGLELLVSGRLNLTFDENFVVTAFSLNGTYDDLCAHLTD